MTIIQRVVTVTAISMHLLACSSASDNEAGMAGQTEGASENQEQSTSAPGSSADANMPQTEPTDQSPEAVDLPPSEPRLVSSTVNGAEVITDNMTGLVWVNDIQYCIAGVTRPENANCGALNEMDVAGLDSWRVPDSQEMSEFIIAADADDTIVLNYINPTCAVMTTSDGWVFTENSSAPGAISQVEPGNAGVRCVAGEPLDTQTRLTTILYDQGSTQLLRDNETELTWVNDLQYCFAGVVEKEAANCQTLNEMSVAGLTDWRSPTTVEMSSLILAVVDDENFQLNYINPSCAVMTTSDGWVFTENSNAPGTISQVQPGNAGLRCVSPSLPTVNQ